MGKNKNLLLLKEGKITKQEYEKRRLQQKEARMANPVKQGKRQVQKQLVATGMVQRKVRPYNPMPSQTGMKTNGKSQQNSGTTTEDCMMNPIIKYTECLVNPSKYMCRYPDSFDRKTALFRSITTYYVPINFGAGTIGRFSMCAQPIIGDTTQPGHYQLAMVNVATDQWATQDWSQPAAYSGPIGGSDPRIDVNAQFLTQSLVGFSNIVSNLASPPSTITGSTFLQNALVTNTVYNTSVNQQNGLKFPVGTFLVNVNFQMLNATAGAINFQYQAGALTTATVNATYLNPNPLTWTLPANGTTNFGFNVEVFVPDTNHNIWNFNVANVATGNPFVAGLLSTMLTNITVTPLNFPTFAQPVLNAGAIEEVRPVAQSLLCTYMGGDLVNGGTIAACYVPPDLVNSNYFSNTTNALGQLQYVENLMKDNTAYNGPLKNGSYTWWSPYDTTDMGFKSISDSNNTEFPAIIVSGVFNPSQIAPTGGFQMVARVELCTVFEFITESTAFELEKYPGSQMIVDAVNSSLREQPHSMPNGKHLAWLQKVGNAIYTFARNNKSALMTMGSLAASLL